MLFLKSESASPAQSNSGLKRLAKMFSKTGNNEKEDIQKTEDNEKEDIQKTESAPNQMIPVQSDFSDGSSHISISSAMDQSGITASTPEELRDSGYFDANRRERQLQAHNASSKIFRGNNEFLKIIKSLADKRPVNRSVLSKSENEVNLYGLFYEPVLQLGNNKNEKDLISANGTINASSYSAACVAASLVADLETYSFFYKLSIPYTYGLLATNNRLGTVPNEALKSTYNFMAKTEGPMDQAAFETIMDQGLYFTPEDMDALVRYGIVLDKQDGVDDRNNTAMIIPADMNKFLEGKSVVKPKAYAALQSDHIDSTLIKNMIDLGQPPIVFISSDSRTFMEDWYRPNPLGNYAHALNIVGYGVDLSPFDNTETAYFIVRDSFVPTPIHYKVAVRELTPMITAVFRSTGADTSKDPPKFE